MYNITIDQMSRLIKKFGSVTIGSERYGSKMEARSIRSGHILASWPTGCGDINKNTFFLTPGIVWVTTSVILLKWTWQMWDMHLPVLGGTSQQRRDISVTQWNFDLHTINSLVLLVLCLFREFIHILLLPNTLVAWLLLHRSYGLGFYSMFCSSFSYHEIEKLPAA